MDIISTSLNATVKPVLNDLDEYPYQRDYEIFSSFMHSIWPVLLFAGLLSNLVNIIVFSKGGVKDSFDFAVDTLHLRLDVPERFQPINFKEQFFSFRNFSIKSFESHPLPVFFGQHLPSTTFPPSSVFLGVTRCACVAMPLRFKSVFTVKKTVAAVLILFCLDVLFHLPMLTAFRLGWVRDPSTNTTSLSLVRDSVMLHAFKQKINDIINKNLIPFVAFIIMIASVALLSFKLFESSKVRSRPYSDPSTKDIPSKSVGAKQTPSHKLSPKDVKVVQSVILVCSIFIIAQLPSVTRTIIRSSWSEFNARGRMIFLAGIFMTIDTTFMMVNALINIFVYYNYNGKYKSVIRSMLNLK